MRFKVHFTEQCKLLVLCSEGKHFLDNLATERANLQSPGTILLQEWKPWRHMKKGQAQKSKDLGSLLTLLYDLGNNQPGAQFPHRGMQEREKMELILTPILLLMLRVTLNQPLTSPSFRLREREGAQISASQSVILHSNMTGNLLGRQTHGPCVRTTKWPKLLNQSLQDAAQKSILTEFPDDSPANMRTTGLNNLFSSRLKTSNSSQAEKDKYYTSLTREIQKIQQVKEYNKKSILTEIRNKLGAPV